MTPELTQRERFVETFTAIELDPQAHRQKSYAYKGRCGTAYCFAGHRCVLSGYEIDWTDGGLGVIGEPDAVVSNMLTSGHWIIEIAMELLGIEDSEVADDLFHPGNDLLALYVKAARILGCSWTSLAAEVEGRVFEAQRESAALIREAAAIPVVVA